MSIEVRNLLINNIKLPIHASFEEAFSVSQSRLKKAGIKSSGAEFSVFRRSVDARKKEDIRFVYSIIAKGTFRIADEKRLSEFDIALDKRVAPEIKIGQKKLSARPVVVGSGPAGLFAALLLAENGYCPIVLERGGSVEERMSAVKRFNESGKLDADTNIQFGAGGAGTFSDGKLITRIGDGLSTFVLEKFVQFGADSEILYMAKPHIGTDVLCKVVDNMVQRIRELGGEVRFHTRLDDIYFADGCVDSVLAGNEKIKSGPLILALGHSARDTYKMLLSKGLAIEAKDFSVGMRIEHLCEDIDRAMYGSFAGDEKLGHAEYALSHNTKERGVYTFCMCPGGEVVAAASEEGGVVVNGMSNHARSGRNSNSAVVCSIFKSDYGSTPEKAIEFQREIERRAFFAGGKDYSAPIITFGDFERGIVRSEPRKVIPTYRGGNFVKLTDPKEFLPDLVCDSIKNAIYAFDKKIKGFADPGAVLTGAETRTSAPIRIIRNPETRTALGYSNLYPTGEGAGYAGGITSAAIDGIKTALSVISEYKPYLLG